MDQLGSFIIYRTNSETFLKPYSLENGIVERSTLKKVQELILNNVKPTDNYIPILLQAENYLTQTGLDETFPELKAIQISDSYCLSPRVGIAGQPRLFYVNISSPILQYIHLDNCIVTRNYILHLKQISLSKKNSVIRIENCQFQNNVVSLTADYIYLSNVKFTKGSRLYLYCNPEHLYFDEINVEPSVYEKQFTGELKSESDLREILDTLS